jgi:HlyD family secretion protein
MPVNGKESSRMPNTAYIRPSSLYRDSALRRLSSPQQLNHCLSVASPANWLVLAALLLLFGATAAWSWKGTVTHTGAGQGILIGAGGLVSINAPGSGQVVAVAVKPGDQVRGGQLIARIGNPVLAEQVRLAEMARADAERQAENNLRLRLRTADFQIHARDTERESLEREIAEREHRTVFAAEQVANHEKLYAEGLTPKSTLVAAQENLAAIQADIARHHAKIEQLRAESFTAQADVARAESDERGRIAELDRRLDGLRQELRQATRAAMPYAGRIIEVKTYPGAMVAAGTPLVTIQPAGDELEALVYLPSQQAKHVKTGMDVQLSPGNTRPEEQGYIRATVLAVAPFPVSPLAVTRKLENEALTSALTGGGPVTEVRIALRRDPADASGYQWSSRRVPRAAVSAGALCTARIVIAKQRPMTLALPALKEALGIE